MTDWSRLEISCGKGVLDFRDVAGEIGRASTWEGNLTRVERTQVDARVTVKILASHRDTDNQVGERFAVLFDSSVDCIDLVGDCRAA